MSLPAWELRIAISHARLPLADREGAAQLLADAIAPFTDGRSTPDLITARALLGEA
jgi:hypothetical protein